MIDFITIQLLYTKFHDQHLVTWYYIVKISMSTYVPACCSGEKKVDCLHNMPKKPVFQQIFTFNLKIKYYLMKITQHVFLPFVYFSFLTFFFRWQTLPGTSLKGRSLSNNWEHKIVIHDEVNSYDALISMCWWFCFVLVCYK